MIRLSSQRCSSVHKNRPLLSTIDKLTWCQTGQFPHTCFSFARVFLRQNCGGRLQSPVFRAKMYLESGAVQGMILHIGNPLGAETASNVVLSAFPENALGHAVETASKRRFWHSSRKKTNGQDSGCRVL